MTAFLAGALVLVVEVAAPRLLTPLFGVGQSVWAATIAVTLLALALGYHVGGRLVERSALRWAPGLPLLVGGVWIALLPVLRTPVLRATHALDVRWGILASSLVLLAFPLFLLGAVTPVLVALHGSSRAHPAGSVGRILFASTVGSVCGALAAGFFLVGVLPTSALLQASGALGIGLGLAWLPGRGRSRSTLIAGVAALGLPLLAASLDVECLLAPLRPGQQVLAVEESFYGEIKVLQGPLPTAPGRPVVRTLLVDGRAQSILDPTCRTSWQAFTYDLQLVRALRPDARRLLLVGLGAGLLARLYAEAGLEVDVVEIDPEIVAVARAWFGFEEGEVRVHVADARAFLASTSAWWDVVVFNAYQGDRLPPHLYTQEALRAVTRVLAPRGVLVQTFYAPAHGRAQAALRATLGSVFSHVRAFARAPRDPVSEFLFFASQDPLSPDWPRFRADPVLEKNLGSRLHDFSQHALHSLHVGPPRILTDDDNPLDAWLRDTGASWLAREIGNWGLGALLRTTPDACP